MVRRCLLAGLIGFLVTFAATTAHAAQRYRVNLPAGTLGNALIELGNQMGISVGVSDPHIARLRVAAVRGNLTPREALDRLLRGKAARYQIIDSTTIRVVRGRAQSYPAARPNSRPAHQSSPPPPPRPPALAEDPASTEEIIVTASKRSIRLDSYPGAVAVLQGDDPVLQSGIRGSDALVSRFPGVTSTHLGSGRNKLFVRGIADSSFTGPTQATTGQYFAETRLNYNAPDPDLRLYDIDRVEVLSGPQGTLYGAGSLGGIIHILPNRPDLDTLEGGASVGTTFTQAGEPGVDAGAVINLPLANGQLGLRMVGYATSEGGYIDDLERSLEDINRTRIFGGRAALRGELGEDWTIDLGGVGQTIRGEDAQFADRELPPLTRRSAVRQDFGNDYALAQLMVTRGWNQHRLVTTASLIRHTLRERYDATLALGIVPLPLATLSTVNNRRPRVYDQLSRVSFLSIESRLSRQQPDGVSWLVGVSGISNRLEQSRAFGELAAPIPMARVSNGIMEGAVYGEASTQLFQGVIATIGGRLSYSSLSGLAVSDGPVLSASLGEAPVFDTVAPTLESRRFQTRFLPSGSLTTEPATNIFLYLRYQEGFRPGGLAISGGQAQLYRSDHISAVEGGLRYGDPDNDRFNAAVSLAYTAWSEIQADVVDLSGFPMTANIGDGRIYSLDMKLSWRPVPGLSFEVAALLNDGRVTTPDAGIGANPSAMLPNVARVNARFEMDYRASVSSVLDLRLSASMRYTGKSVLGFGPLLDREQGDWHEVSLNARLESERFALVLAVSNLLNSTGNRFSMGSPVSLGQVDQITPLRPRSVRIGVDFRF